MALKMLRDFQYLMRPLPTGFVVGTGSPELCASQAIANTALLHFVSHLLPFRIQLSSSSLLSERPHCVRLLLRGPGLVPGDGCR